MPDAAARPDESSLLADMAADPYFPVHLVAKGKEILLRLSARIETERPADLPALYVLTQAATEEFNDREEEFEAAGSEIETVARDDIGRAFWNVVTAHGFDDADPEELIATREW